MGITAIFVMRAGQRSQIYIASFNGCLVCLTRGTEKKEMHDIGWKVKGNTVRYARL